MPKFIFLLIIREAYLFLRNFLGLVYHPYKTMNVIRQEKDFSQTVLLSFWPLPVWFGLAALLIASKFFFHLSAIFNQAIKFIFMLYTLCFILYAFYLAYWFIFYLKVRQRIKR